MDFEEFSLDAKAALAEGGITKIEELALFDLAELRSTYRFSLKDVTEYGRKRKREEENPHDPKNGEIFIMKGLNDNLNLKSLLPNTLPNHDAISLRQCVYGVLGPKEVNPHTKQEIDFLVDLTLMVKHEKDVRFVVWCRLMQVIIKGLYPSQALQVGDVWNSVLSKVSTESDMELTRVIIRVKEVLDKERPKLTAPYQQKKMQYKGKYEFRRIPAPSTS